ncbi:hypothetical protein ACWEPI_31255 [Streptomyces sp. NPDC004262]
MTQPADEEFWERIRAELATPRTLLLEEACLRGAVRWHRLTANNLDTVRAVLGQRALLTVWPGLTSDVQAVLAALPKDESVHFVWETANGTIRHATVDETDRQQLTTLVTGATAACILPLVVDRHHPLFEAALPDNDGVLRARW